MTELVYRPRDVGDILAQKIISDNRTLVDHLVDVLIDKETIEGEEFRQLLNQSSLQTKVVSD